MNLFFTRIARCLPVLAAVAAVACGTDRTTDWYPIERDHKPFLRWWWLGSAVDEAGLTANLEAFAAKGVGGVEITPIYGVRGNEANEVDYLSPRWMELLRHTIAEGERLGVQVDMNNGTGWPFGGPTVSWDESTAQFFIERYPLRAGERLHEKLRPSDPRQRGLARLQCVTAVQGDRRIDLTGRVTPDTVLDWRADAEEQTLYALFAGRSRFRVKRAAPGGEGLVFNPYDSTALRHYLDRFDEAFAASGCPWPGVLFNDSFEAHNADWDDRLPALFEARYGYRIEEYLDVLAGDRTDEAAMRVLTDYRALLAELLLDEFTVPWTRWARSHGACTRNQAHGSPANLVDLYAAVDIPECESYGQTPYRIDGLHRDGISRPNDGDLPALKFASSAAHITGKRRTSAEALTWLSEHFRTSLALCKPEVDHLFAAGVDHLCFHGAPYTPPATPFPGWKFYATVDLSSANTIWRDADGLFDYVARTQAFLSAGEPDNDFLLYFPVFDLWSVPQRRPFVQFDIHRMEQTMPAFKEAVRSVLRAGYDADYVSDRYLADVTVESDGRLRTAGGATYRALILPAVRTMPHTTLAKVAELARRGATIVVAERLPEAVPGLGCDRAKREEAFRTALAALSPVAFDQTTVAACGRGRIVVGSDYATLLAATGVRPEPFRTTEGNLLLRRRNEAGGRNYFLAHLAPGRFDGWVELATEAAAVEVFDPVTGERGMAAVERGEGTTRVRLQLPSGGSLLLKSFPEAPKTTVGPWYAYAAAGDPIALDRGWSIRFTEAEPAVEGCFETDTLTRWEALPDERARETAGTARYAVRFTLDDPAAADDWLLELGDVRESARVRINGAEAAVLWAVPFEVRIGGWLRAGENRLEIDVTNLPANRIAAMERRGEEWRIFKDTNINSVVLPKPFSFGDWATVESGLNAPVRLVPLRRIER